MTKLKNVLFSLVKAYKYSLCLYMLLFIIAFIFRINILGESLPKDLLFAGLNAILILLVVIIFARTIFRIPVIILVSLLISADLGLFCFYGGLMNYGILASIMETNLSEAFGMGKLVLPAGIVAFVVLYFLINKSTLEIKKKPAKIKTILFYTAAILFGIFILPGLFSFAEFKSNIAITTRYNKTLSTTAYYSSVIRWKYPLVINDIFIASAYFDEMAKFREDMNRTKTLPEGVLFDQEKGKIDKIIVVLGESSNRENYSLYGYNIKTTSFLDSLSAKSPELVSFYDHIISPASVTRDAVRICLSFSTVLNFQPFIDNKNVVDLANDAGYETAWVSNQNRMSWVENFTYLIAKSSDTCVFRPDISPNDLDLIPVIDNIQKPGVKQFMVVHLAGNHQPYDDKYDREDSKMLGSSGKTIDYDKSIHHTDRVLREIYKLFAKTEENTLIYYFSDHSEKVNEGHAILNKYKIQYHIPLIVMQNNAFINADSLICKYYDKQTGRLNTSSNIFQLSELMGYRVADSLIEKSKIDGRYIIQPDGSYCLYDAIKE
ncbi:phosphoethanolamine transferase [Viscerimonas tarda]